MKISDQPSRMYLSPEVTVRDIAVNSIICLSNEDGYNETPDVDGDNNLGTV